MLMARESEVKVSKVKGVGSGFISLDAKGLTDKWLVLSRN